MLVVLVISACTRVTQIGRVRTGGQVAVCLNLPGRQGSLEAFGRRRRLYGVR
jgi:hypothetical protein